MGTYLDSIADQVAAAVDPVNAALAAAGLDELRDFFCGEPKGQPRENNTPYAWWDFDAYGEVRGEQATLETPQFAAEFGVVVALGGGTPEELLAMVAGYPPLVVAAIERAWSRYDLTSLGIFPGPRSSERGLFRLVLLPFRVVGLRRYGGVL